MCDKIWKTLIQSPLYESASTSNHVCSFDRLHGTFLGSFYMTVRLDKKKAEHCLNLLN